MTGVSRHVLVLIALSAVLSAGCVRDPLKIDIRGVEFQWDETGMAGANVTFVSNAAPDNWNSMRYIEWFQVTLDDGQRWNSDDWDKQSVEFSRAQAPGPEGMGAFALQASPSFRSDFSGIVPSGPQRAYSLEWKLGIGNGFDNSYNEGPWTMASFNGSIQPGQLNLVLGDPHFECSDDECKLRRIDIHVESTGPTPLYVNHARLFLGNSSTPSLSRVPVIEFTPCEGDDVPLPTIPEYYRLFYGDAVATFGSSMTTAWPACLGTVPPGFHQLRLLAWTSDGSLVSSSERLVFAADS